MHDHKRIMDLEAKVIDLQQGTAEFDWKSKLINRVSRLENWKENHYCPDNDNRHNQSEYRLKKLEEWRNQETYHSILAKRVSKLEEWQECINDGQSIDLMKSQKTDNDFKDIQAVEIDKKVWEDIKHRTTMVEPFNNNCGCEAIKNGIDNLKDAIKKADPSWCPND